MVWLQNGVVLIPEHEREWFRQSVIDHYGRYLTRPQ